MRSILPCSNLDVKSTTVKIFLFNSTIFTTFGQELRYFIANQTHTSIWNPWFRSQKLIIFCIFIPEQIIVLHRKCQSN